MTGTWVSISPVGAVAGGGVDLPQLIQDAGLIEAAHVFVTVTVVRFAVSGLLWVVSEFRGGYREPGS